MKRILVVGAGLSGASAARVLAENGCSVDIIDIRGVIGGNCADHKDENGIFIQEHGSHIFHTKDDEVWKFVNRFCTFNDYIHRVLVHIDGKDVPLPFGFDGIKEFFGKDEAKTIEEKLVTFYGHAARIPISDLMSQEDSDMRNLAEFVYEKVFLHYTEKQWGISPEEVGSAVTSRVPVCAGRDSRYFTDIHQGIPVDGFTSMISKMLDHPGINLHLNTPFKDMENLLQYDKIVFSGPVDELMDYGLGPLPYRSERFEYESLEQIHYQNAAVVNHPCAEGFTRIHEYKYYQGIECPVTVIAKEYPEAHIPGKNEPYYPVPGEENRKLHEKYVELASQKYPNMIFIGRLGEYRYLDMDKAVRRAIDAARSLLAVPNKI